jgi:hypothetical protein
MKRQVHITSLSLPAMNGLLLVARAVKKKPGYPGSVDPRPILSDKLHSDSQDTQGSRAHDQ